jgi:hypothetical protein
MFGLTLTYLSRSQPRSAGRGEKGAARAIELCVYFGRPLTFVLQGGLTKLEPDENDGEHARIGKNAMLSLCTVPSRNLICPGKPLRH